MDTRYLKYISWDILIMNANAIYLLEKHLDYIHWEDKFSSNPNAIHLLKKNPKWIDWNKLSGNPNAIHLLKKIQNG